MNLGQTYLADKASFIRKFVTHPHALNRITWRYLQTHVYYLVTTSLCILSGRGGFNDQASSGTVQLIRLNPNGTVDRRDIKVDLAKGLDSANNPALRNNDTIIVSKSGLNRAGTTLGAVGQVLGGIINPFNSILGVLRIFGISPGP